MDCIFCKIVAGQVPSFKVYEDENVFAFLDIHPFSKGHTLVVPKRHAENIFDIASSDLEKVITVGKEIAERLKTRLGADGVRLSQSNGKVAGQEVMHFHLHVISRYRDDGLDHHPAGVYPMPQADAEELKEIAEKLQ